MAKIKLTKGELKKQRDALKQFEHYLPTLQLKKQQLQVKILEVNKALQQRQVVLAGKLKDIEPWAGLLADPQLLSTKGVDPEKYDDTWAALRQWIQPQDVRTRDINIAGANVPLFEDVIFAQPEYDLWHTPFWFDKGLRDLREMVSLLVEVQLLKKQKELLARELRVTTQRVNLFEKIKIPECQENIRRVRIYLGDQQANAVGIGKVAKKKIEAKLMQPA